MLRDLGYTITSVNYNSPDYVEYEVVKGDRSYEVQMDLDEDTGRATDIDIDPNIWKADRTEARLEQSDSEQSNSEQTDQTASLNNPGYIMVITPMYVATAQDRTKMGRMVQELENLPVGKSKDFYRGALEQRGYQITDSASKKNRTQFSVEKNGMQALVNLRFDEDSGESTQLAAFPLLVNVGQENAAQGSTARSGQSSQSRGMSRTVQELESLPVGHGKKFYRNALQQRGYQITDTTTSANETQFEAEKNGQRVALNVMFDDQGKSTDIEASRMGGQGKSSQMSKAQQSGSNQQFAENQ
jgi:hypothetical protein